MGEGPFCPKATLYSDASFKCWFSDKTISWTQKWDTKIDLVAVKKVYFCLYCSHLCHVGFYHLSRLWVGATESHCWGNHGWTWSREELQHFTEQSLFERLWSRACGEMWDLACSISVDVRLLVLLSDYLHISPLGWAGVRYVPNEEKLSIFDSCQLLKKMLKKL